MISRFTFALYLVLSERRGRTCLAVQWDASYDCSLGFSSTYLFSMIEAQAELASPLPVAREIYHSSTLLYENRQSYPTFDEMLVALLRQHRSGALLRRHGSCTAGRGQ